MKRVLLALMMVSLAVVLVACGGRNGDENGEDFNYEELTDGITIMIPFYLARDVGTYVRLFNEIHPDVQVNIETYTGFFDISQRMALTTRLLSNPPDILLFNGEQLVFEKMVLETVFLDLNNFLDGPRGIDRNNYFDNILRAAETQGGLFHLPHYINIGFGFLNQRLLDIIGLDGSQITTLTIDEEIDLFLRISQTLPEGETIFHSTLFSVQDAFLRGRLYDIDARTVFVNTPEMQQRIERAMQIPLHSNMTLTPDGLNYFYSLSTSDVARYIHPSQDLLLTTLNGPILDITTFFLEYHPNFQFTHPVRLLYGEDGVGFMSRMAYALPRNASNHDLAWEFLRFVIEFEEQLYRLDTGFLNPHYDTSFRFLPINRNRFNNQVGFVLEDIYNAANRYAGLEQHLPIPQEQHRAATIAETMGFLYGTMEQANFEIRQDRAVLNSLIYPDIWLLYSGQQNVAQALANIHSRLELYVHE
ncbi:MAG: hypothetical protein LBE35_04350 [Clostridiales bacterium]|jgi:ABC-type glycerol-3-phosphate transport system substrate-binding protein|nr:hypothetical protein [Clostridiales bacterium]